MKNKKGEGQTIWIIITMVLALAVVFVYFFWIADSNKAIAETKNVIGSCESRGGTCEVTCAEGRLSLGGLGCPADLNKDGTKDSTEKTKKTCCRKKGLWGFTDDDVSP